MSIELFVAKIRRLGKPHNGGTNIVTEGQEDPGRFYRDSDQFSTMLSDQEQEIMEWMLDTGQWPRGSNGWSLDGPQSSPSQRLTVNNEANKRIWLKIFEGYKAGKMPNVEEIHVLGGKYEIIDF